MSTPGNLQSAILEALARGPKPVAAVCATVQKRYPAASFEAVASACTALETAEKIEYRFKAGGKPRYALVTVTAKQSLQDAARALENAVNDFGNPSPQRTKALRAFEKLGGFPALRRLT